ncbi:MAG: potassium-transporting ATPase subunit F [Dehalococcoidia bacterium]|nr:potassium-transporting ATPase subunit F [Dehalococcoidia bacterium]
MDAENLIALTIALVLGAYVLYALLRAEEM